MENRTTKTEWVLEGLHKVEEFHRNRPVLPGRINLHQMVQDCIDVIEDLNKQIEIMREELRIRKAQAWPQIFEGHIPALKVEDIVVDEERLQRYLDKAPEKIKKLMPDTHYGLLVNDSDAIRKEFQDQLREGPIVNNDPLIVWNHDPSRKLDMKIVMANLDFDKTEVEPDGSIFVPFNEQPEFMEQIEKLREVEEHNALLEKMRAELRGDICE